MSKWLGKGETPRHSPAVKRKETPGKNLRKNNGRKVQEMVGFFEKQEEKKDQEITTESGRKLKEKEWMKVVKGDSVTKDNRKAFEKDFGKEKDIVGLRYGKEIGRKRLEGKSQKGEGGDVTEERRIWTSEGKSSSLPKWPAHPSGNSEYFSNRESEKQRQPLTASITRSAEKGTKMGTKFSKSGPHFQKGDPLPTLILEPRNALWIKFGRSDSSDK